MKETILIVAAIISFTIQANSQITKGNWMVGGNASFSTNNTSSLQGGDALNFQISPRIGYFLRNNFAMGIQFDYASQDLSNYTQSIRVGLIVKRFSLGPFVRYYFLNPEKQVNVFLEGNYSYGSYESKGYYLISNGRNNNYSLQAGTAIYFNSSVAIEFTLGYYLINDITYGYNNNGLSTGIGFQIHLEK